MTGPIPERYRRWLEVAFDAEGRSRGAGDERLIDQVRARGATDVLMLAHGWNNDVAAARTFFHGFFDLLDRVREEPRADMNRAEMLQVGILWPSTGPVQALVGLSVLGLGLGNLFPMGLSVTVALAPDRVVTASGRAVGVTAFAVLLAPLTVGTLADATSLTAALAVVPVALACAATGLTIVTRTARREAVRPL